MQSFDSLQVVDTDPHDTSHRRARVHFTAPVILAAMVSSGLMVLSLSPTFAAITATITNTKNTAGFATISITETEYDGSGTATGTSCASVQGSNVDCPAIDKLGGRIDWSASVAADTSTGITRKVRLLNNSQVPIKSVSGLFGTCKVFSLTTTDFSTGGTAGSASNLCGQFSVDISMTSSEAGDSAGIVSGSPKTPYAWSGLQLGANSGNLLAANKDLANGQYLEIVFTTKILAGATDTNLKIHAPITWSFST